MTIASSFSTRWLASPGAAVTLALLLAGCGKTETASYRIPKDKDGELPPSMTRPASPSSRWRAPLMV